MALSLKHQAFVDEYLKDRNATQAVIRAGYSANGARATGNRLLTDPDINTAIAARAEKASAVADVSVAWVLREAKATYQDAKAAGQYAAATKCLELVGRHLAMFTDNHRVTIDPEQRESRLRAILGIADRN